MFRKERPRRRAHFFSRLSYSFGNEDWRSEQEALMIKKEDRILSITASGDRPLHLLLDKCAEVVSIDANPIQNYLLNLKCLAMQKFSYHDYISFLGAIPDEHRLNKLQKLLPYMEESAQKYWIKNTSMIHKGVLYQGVVEKRCQILVAPFFQTIRGKKVKQLFEFSDINQQREFVVRSWDKLYWRKFFDFAFNSFLSRLLIRCVVNDPGLYDHLNRSISLGNYLYKRMHESLMENLARESLLFSLFLKGRVDQEAFPPYLREDGVDIIKKQIDRISVKDIDILTYLQSTPDNSFDCFSLSDVASYLNQKEFLIMLREVKRVAKPGARFSIRQFLSNHKIPQDMQSAYCRDTSLEKKLEREDRCFVYRFMAGTIHKI